MGKKIPRTVAAVAGCAALGVLGAIAASTPGAAMQDRPTAKTPAAQASRTPAPGTQLWAKRLNGSRNPYDRPSRVAVSPDGRTVFITAPNREASSADDYVTVAYDASTGARRWAQRYNGPANSFDNPAAVAVSPSGKTVFVTGTSERGAREDYATVAYSAATGTQLWVTRSHDPVNLYSLATSVAVSPDGRKVFVTGYSNGGHPGACLTVAYDAATGTPLWAKRYSGPSGISLAISPTGNTVFVTGGATVAYRAASGARLWVRHYRGHPGSSVAVSPDGKTVFTAGIRYLSQTQSDYLTTAYRAATGTRLWTQRYSKPAHSNRAAAVAVSPNGKKVFVTGTSSDGDGRSGFLTIAYRATTGTQLWLQRHSKPAHSNVATCLAVSPTGGTVYVAGGGYATDKGSYATVAYRATTGARLWVRGYNGPAGGDNYASAVAASPDGQRVFVTGSSWGGKGYDYVTIAYRG